MVKKYEYQSNVMNGDIVIFNGLVCEVEILGKRGGYATIDDVYTNITTATKGFLRVLETTKQGAIDFPIGRKFRAEWRTCGLRMVKRFLSIDV